jgi:DNA-directed RNA polymerase beta' subunit
MQIPDRIRDELILADAHGLKFREWMVMKKYLLRVLPSKMRTHFSTRDSRTKRQSLNEFEDRLIEYYQAQTGNILRLPNDYAD